MSLEGEEPSDATGALGRKKRQSGASPSVRNRSARGSGYPANKGSNPVSRGWPPNACGKLTARLIEKLGGAGPFALHGRGTVAQVDLQAGKVLGEVPVDAGPYDIAASADTLYVTCSDGDSLVLIDRGKFTVRKRVAIGQAPRGLYVDAERQRVYVACHDEQAVRCFHETTGQIQTTPLRAFPDRVAGAGETAAAPAAEIRGAFDGQPVAAEDLAGWRPRADLDEILMAVDAAGRRAPSHDERPC